MGFRVLGLIGGLGFWVWGLSVEGFRGSGALTLHTAGTAWVGVGRTSPHCRNELQWGNHRHDADVIYMRPQLGFGFRASGSFMFGGKGAGRAWFGSGFGDVGFSSVWVLTLTLARGKQGLNGWV